MPMEKTPKARKAPVAATPNAPKAPTANSIAARIQQQLSAVQATPLDLSVHRRPSSTDVSRAIGDKLFAGKADAADLYRSYKNSPHHPSSLLLKYIVHRVNSLDEYDRPSPSVEQGFLGLHQAGGAGDKNAHVRIDHLHNWLRLNPKLPEQLLKHRQHLHDLIRQGIGLNLRRINGREYIALARGLNRAVVSDEHGLASFSDRPSTSRMFGTHVHPMWVPLEDLWYSYDLGPTYPRGHQGAEDEFLVAHDPRRPRYHAEEKNVTGLRTRLLFGDEGTVHDVVADKDHSVLTMDGIVRLPGKQKMLTRTFVAPFADSSSDEEIAAGLEAHQAVRGIRGDLDRLYRNRFRNDSDYREDRSVAMPGPRTLAVLLNDGGGVTEENVGAAWMPRDHARAFMEAHWLSPGQRSAEIAGPARNEYLPDSFLENPNLNSDDLHWFIDRKAEEGWHTSNLSSRADPGAHVQSLMKHPAVDGSHIERIYDLGRRTYQEGRQHHRDALLAHEAYHNSLKAHGPSGHAAEVEPLWLRFDEARRAAREWGIDERQHNNEPFRRVWDKTLSSVAAHPKTPSKVLHDILDTHLADTKLLASQMRESSPEKIVPSHQPWDLVREGAGTRFSSALGNEFARNPTLTHEHVGKLHSIYAAETSRDTRDTLLAFAPVAKRVPVPESMWRQWMQEHPNDTRGILAGADYIPPAMRRELFTTVPTNGADAAPLIAAVTGRNDFTPQELDAITDTASRIDPELANDNVNWLRPRATIASNLLRRHAAKLSARAVVKIAEMLSDGDWSHFAHDLPLESLWGIRHALRPDSKDRPLGSKLRILDDLLRHREDLDRQHDVVMPLPHEELAKAEPTFPDQAGMTSGQVAIKIKAQTVKQRRASDASDDLAERLSKTPVQSVGKDPLIEHSVLKLAGSGGTIESLYRNYKHTPHSVPSLFLKYAVHRINHLHAYEDLGLARKLDDDFLALHQSGGAAEKNGHVLPQDLHELLYRNSHVPELLLRAQARLHAYVKAGCGLSSRTINGEPHIALTRGLSQPTMGDEHALSSWGDIRNTGIGSHMYRAWVPLKDVWFTFEAAPEHVRGDFGHENEWLVSKTRPRYLANESDVAASRFADDTVSGGIRNSLPLTGPVGVADKRISPLHLHAHAFDNATDAEIGRSLVAKARYFDQNHAALSKLHISHNAGPLTFEALRRHYLDEEKRPQLPDWMISRSFTPREHVMDAYRAGREDAEGIKPALAIQNPNLNAEDLVELTQPLVRERNGASRVYSYVPVRPFIGHPAYSEKVAHALYDIAESGVGDRQSAVNRWGEDNVRDPRHDLADLIQHERTPASVVGRYIDHALAADGSAVSLLHSLHHAVKNPNHTTDQADKILAHFRDSPDGLPLHHLYHSLKLSPDEIERLWESDDPWSQDARPVWLVNNPHVPEKDLLRAASTAWSSPTMRALADRARGLPTSVQRALWDRVGDTPPGPGASYAPYTDALVKLAEREDLDHGVAAEIAKATLAAYADGGEWFPATLLGRALVRNRGLPIQVKKPLIEARGDLREFLDSRAILPHGPGHVLLPLPADVETVKKHADAELALAMCGGSLDGAFDAAQFLSGRTVSDKTERAALKKFENDLVGAAINAHGLTDDTATRRALEGVLKVYSLEKFEIGFAQTAPRIEAALDSSSETANWIRRAYKEGGVRPAILNGKHSKGALIARVSGDVFLLKPGSGAQSPAAGARQEKASQSQREVAFWRIADVWGVGDQMPRADLLLIDGKEYAAIHMLPLDYKNLGIKAHEEKGLVPKCLEPYRASGMLHKWAILDWVLGNTDRHSQNMMISYDNKTVKLIDEGSAFAGDAFDPAGDDDSFIPYYLRAWTDRRFSEMTPDDRVRLMPTAGHAGKALRAWVQGLAAGKLRYLCNLYGINPEPSLARLALVQDAANAKEPVDEAVNRLWAGA